VLTETPIERLTSIGDTAYGNADCVRFSLRSKRFDLGREACSARQPSSNHCLCSHRHGYTLNPTDPPMYHDLFIVSSNTLQCEQFIRWNRVYQSPSRPVQLPSRMFHFPLQDPDFDYASLRENYCEDLRVVGTTSPFAARVVKKPSPFAARSPRPKAGTVGTAEIELPRVLDTMLARVVKKPSSFDELALGRRVGLPWVSAKARVHVLHEDRSSSTHSVQG
jgi:hypothetical protein